MMDFGIRYQLVSLTMRNPDLTKEKILVKSGILFNTQGYKSTSLSEITDATGLTKGAIYRHFESKDKLEQESLYHLSNILFEKVRTVIKSKETASEKLHAIFQFFSTYITNPPIKGGCPLLNASTEADDTNPVLRKGALRILNVLRDSLVAVLENGIRYKQLKADIDVEYYATVFIASLEGAIMMSKLRGNDDDIKRVVKHLESLVAQMKS
jgi:TetR/AcrR family transcriptional regulator, transcriptional repressor for nem operon